MNIFLINVNLTFNQEQNSFDKRINNQLDGESFNLNNSTIFSSSYILGEEYFPAPKMNPIKTPDADGTYVLQWTEFPGATSYDLYRSTSEILDIKGLEPITIELDNESNHYKGVFTFASDVVGEFPEGWNFDEMSSGSEPKITQIVGNHKNVLELYDDSSSSRSDEPYVDFTPSSQGAIEFYMRSDDTYKKSWVRLNDGNLNLISFYFRSDRLYAYSGNSIYNVMSIRDDVWYYLRIEFDCSTNTYNLSVDGILKANNYNFRNSGNIDRFLVATDNWDSNYHSYYDSISPNWMYNYIDGDLLEVENRPTYQENNIASGSYYYAVQARTPLGISYLSNSVEVEVINTVECYAILVGISDYPGSDFDLSFCDDDVLDMEQFIRNRFEVPENNIITLINSGARSSEISEAIDSVSSIMDSNDYLIFYYSGHGDYEGVTPGEEIAWSVQSPHNYPNNYDVDWHYSYPGAQLMRVHFTRIDTEVDYDVVWVGDYNDFEYYYDMYSGSHTNEWSSWVFTEDIYVELYTDTDTTGWGFAVDKVQIGYFANPYIIYPYDEIDDGMTDFTLDSELDKIPGKIIVILDTCFSGGFGEGLNQENRYIISSCGNDELSIEDPSNRNGLFTYQFLNSWNNDNDENQDGVQSFEEIFSDTFTNTVSRSSVLDIAHHPTELDNITGEILLEPYLDIIDYELYDGNLELTLSHSGLGYGTAFFAFYDIPNNEYSIGYSSSSLIGGTGIQNIQIDNPGGNFEISAFTAILNRYNGFNEEYINISSYFSSDSFDNISDSDNDGLTDLFEFYIGTNPWSNDSDNDNLPDQWELNNSFNPIDGKDGQLDIDSDGLSNSDEFLYNTSLYHQDSDLDGIMDGWEVMFSLNPLNGSDVYSDFDSDGIINLYEYLNNTNPWKNDSDDDGLTDLAEINTWGTTPWRDDSDQDQLGDYDELYVYNTLPMDSDTDNDGLGDGWEVNYSFDPLSASDAEGDFDEDGLSNLEEFIHNTNPLAADTDDDGMPDNYEVQNSLNPLLDDGSSDVDNDFLSNLNEFLLGTDPNSNDTDNDGLGDGWEVYYSLDPLSASDAGDDFDEDGLSNLNEFIHGTNPLAADTDDDGMSDNYEVVYSLNPLQDDGSSDADNDFLSNLDEFLLGTNPNRNDTDNDLITDFEEIFIYFTNATNADSDGDLIIDGEEILYYSTDPNKYDTDGDGLGDGEEILYYSTDPNKYDTDGDGVSDWLEVNVFRSNPLFSASTPSLFLAFTFIIIASVGAVITGAKNYSLTHKIEREDLPSPERPEKSPIKTEKPLTYKPYSYSSSNYSKTPSSGSTYSRPYSSRYGDVANKYKPTSYGSKYGDITSREKPTSFGPRYGDITNKQKSPSPGSSNLPKNTNIYLDRTNFKCPYCGGSVIKNLCSLCRRTYKIDDYWW